MSQGGIQPGSVKTLALDKSKAFVGVQKKSRFQKASRDMQQPRPIPIPSGRSEGCVFACRME